MNNCYWRTRKLNRLIWIENHGYWVYQCLTCQKVEFERKTNPFDWGGIYD